MKHVPHPTWQLLALQGGEAYATPSITVISFARVWGMYAISFIKIIYFIYF